MSKKESLNFNSKMVKILRFKLFLDQQEFAKLMNVTNSAISHWESGRRIPNGAHIKKMLDLAYSHNIKIKFNDFFCL